ncbi:hypothetical protein GQ457_04G021430 [Hibiscus cannabinus]
MGPFPTVNFLNRVHEQIEACLKIVIIVRLLGRTIGYGTLRTRVLALWKPIVGGRERLLESADYLSVQPWNRSFSTSKKHPLHVIVWVRMQELPYCYYTKTLIRVIAHVVGHVVRVNYNTTDGESAKFARLAIMVDIHKPLTFCIAINGFIQKQEYEGLYNICFTCELYGHSKELFFVTLLQVLDPVDKGTEDGNSTRAHTDGFQGADLYDLGL